MTTMSKASEAKRLEGVSIRARKLYRRLKDEGRFYRAYREDTPKAMAELEAAGLVGISGRVNVITACYVPRRGFKTFKMEEWLR